MPNAASPGSASEVAESLNPGIHPGLPLFRLRRWWAAAFRGAAADAATPPPAPSPRARCCRRYCRAESGGPICLATPSPAHRPGPASRDCATVRPRPPRPTATMPPLEKQLRGPGAAFFASPAPPLPPPRDSAPAVAAAVHNGSAIRIWLSNAEEVNTNRGPKQSTASTSSSFPSTLPT